MNRTFEKAKFVFLTMMVASFMTHAGVDQIATAGADNAHNYDVFNIANHSNETIRAEYRVEITSHLVKTSDPIKPQSFLTDRIPCEYNACMPIYIKFINDNGDDLCTVDTKENIYQPEQTYSVNYYKSGSCDIRRVKQPSTID
ncbi:hypothetical protein [Endozoicomonas elysicola]|uniref:Uncharacterized protein n=1 Tax=Endozoicomonas elysicola TaxID=305900 RepID=A0A081KAC2_9GAMM|nr:hypothetical protein [Endozoicomonas elysicola]KEI71098.1 hypothetical protein GV64_10390 [Endozoicomonas elysicola]